MHFKSAPENALVTSLSLVVVLLGLLLLPRVPYFHSMSSRFTDTLFLLRAEASRSDAMYRDDIVVVGIDDESYRRLNRAWPWRREVFAIFLETLQEYKPKVVGMDVTFVGKGAYPEDDAWLSDAMKKNGNVVIASYFSPEGTYIEPLDMFRENASARGFVDKSLDFDFIHRQSRFITKFRGSHKPVYSFAAEVACRYKGQDTSSCVEELLPQADPSPRPLSYRYHPDDFRYVPMWKILVKGVPKQELAGKMLVVGAVSPIFHDIHNTPLGFVPGIYVNANETLMLLQKDFVRPLFGNEAFMMILLALTILFSLAYYRISAPAQLAMLSLSIAASYLAGWVALYHFNYILPPLPLMGVSFTSYTVCASYRGIAAFSENTRLQRIAITDGLTGLYGQRYLSVRVAKEFEYAENSNRELCYAMLDVDQFKQINDQYGHEEGNAVLMSLARIIRKNVRGVDVAARYGGDEFSILFIDCPLDRAKDATEKIKRIFDEQVFFTPAGEFHASLSAGLCSNRSKGISTKEELIRAADQALYRSKTEGRSRISVYHPNV